MKFKRILATIISIGLVITSVGVVANAANSSSISNSETEIRKSVIAEYQNDPEFIRMKNANPTLAQEYINTIVAQKIKNNSKISINTTTNGGSLMYCYVTNVTQSTTTNCSAATLLQTMYALNKTSNNTSAASNIYGSTPEIKQATLYNLTTAKNKGARVDSIVGTPLYVWEIQTYLNNQLTTNKYDYKLGSSYTLLNFKAKIAYSLQVNRPVLLHAMTGPLDYYNGTNLNHYLSLDEYNAISNTVRIVDCNYNSSYLGAHSNVSAEQAWRSVHDTAGRYFISAIN